MSENRRELAELLADPNNRRVHTTRNLDMLREALTQVGAARSIVVDEHDVVLAGNGVTAAAVQAGIAHVRIVDASGDELIAVRRRGLSDEQKRALALFDNRTAELAEWDTEALAADKERGLSLQPFWTQAEEDTLLGTVADAEWAGMPDFHQDDLLAHRTIRVHFRTDADVEAFAALIGQAITTHAKYLWFPAAEPESMDVVFAGDEK